MAVGLKPIRSEADYEAALEEVERLWGAGSGTPEGDRLAVLATLIEVYEAKRHFMDPPDPVEAIRFRMEQLGLTRKDLEPMIGPPQPGGGRSQPQVRPVDRHDPAIA